MDTLDEMIFVQNMGNVSISLETIYGGSI